MRSRQIVLHRLHAQRISSTTFEGPAEAVSWLGAVQAQDYLGALWAVALRLTDASESDVERALAEGSIVRTWPMRGTLHFVAAADARWMTELLAPRPAAAAAGRLRSYGIDERLLARARRVLAKNLEGGRRLTRPATYRLFEDAGIGASDQRGLHLLWKLAQECFVCFGPREGKQQTFVLFDEWLPGAKKLPREEALARLAPIYLRSHGPATVRDFAWWSGLTLTEARRAIDLAGEGVAEELVGGERYWTTSASEPRARSAGSPRVLPAFDEYLVGYTDRSAQVDASVSKRIGVGGILSPVVVVDGRVVATWKRRLERDAVVCAIDAFEELRGATLKGVNEALERYARFLGKGVRVDGSAG